MALSHRAGCVLITLPLLLLGACTTTPGDPSAASPPATRRLPSIERDGPGALPPDVSRIPDAEPRIEPIRPGGPNKPYEVAGREYVPIREDKPFTERGLASWYGRKFHGRRTASGEPYDMNAMTAAHPTLPLPSYVRVTNPRNGREIVVRVNDRGPFVRGRIIDLSYVAAIKLGVEGGLTPVEVTRLTFDEIRTGAWRRGPAPGEPVLASSSARPAPDAAVVVDVPVLLASVPEKPPVAEAPALVGPPEAPAIAVAVQATTPAPTATTEPVRPVIDPPPSPSRGFWVQLAAFRDRAGADSFHRKVIADLEWLGPLLAVVGEANVFRLQAGPYASRDEAQSALQRVRDQLKLVPVIVERK